MEGPKFKILPYHKPYILGWLRVWDILQTSAGIAWHILIYCVIKGFFQRFGNVYKYIICIRVQSLRGPWFLISGKYLDDKHKNIFTQIVWLYQSEKKKSNWRKCERQQIILNLVLQKFWKTRVSQIQDSGKLWTSSFIVFP